MPPLRPRYKRGHAPRKRLGWVSEDRGYETPCHISQGRPTDDGYLQRKRSIGGQRYSIMAHREAWIAANGPIPEGLILHHKCEQPPCENLDHLELKSPADHVRIGRATSLTVDDVRAIRASPMTAVDLAPIYGITAYSIRNIRKRKTWADVE